MKAVKTLTVALILIAASVSTAAPCAAKRTGVGRHAHTAATSSIVKAIVKTGVSAQAKTAGAMK